MIVADTHDWLLFFTDKGKIYRKRVFEVNQDSSRTSRGTPIQNLIDAINPSEEVVTAVVNISDPNADQYIFMATRKGKIKKMHLSKFTNIRRSGIAAFDLEKDDSLLTARLVSDGMTAILVSRNGKGVQFNIDDVTIRQGRTAGGVRGIKLIEDDHVVAMDVATPDAQLMILSSRGYGKRTAVEKFRITGRNVQGVIAMKITDKTGPIAAAVVTGPDVEEIMVGSQKAMVFRTPIMEIRSMGRATQGVQVMTKLSEEDRVISMSAFKERTWEDFEEASVSVVTKPDPIAKTQDSDDDDRDAENFEEVEDSIESETSQSQLTMDLPTEDEVDLDE